MDWIATVILAVLLVGTNALWAYLTHKLINKLMARDFWNYQQAKEIPKNKKAELAEALAKVKIPLETGPNELDTLDGMIKAVMPFG